MGALHLLFVDFGCDDKGVDDGIVGVCHVEERTLAVCVGFTGFEVVTGDGEGEIDFHELKIEKRRNLFEHGLDG